MSSFAFPVNISANLAITDTFQQIYSSIWNSKKTPSGLRADWLRSISLRSRTCATDGNKDRVDGFSKILNTSSGYWGLSEHSTVSGRVCTNPTWMTGVLLLMLIGSCFICSRCRKDLSIVSILEKPYLFVKYLNNFFLIRSVIIDSLQRTFISPDVATIFIFCQDEKEQTSTDLLRNILAQLVYRKRSLSHATSSLYYSESLTGDRASPKAYQNAIRAEVNRFSKVFFVVDGLDMFPDKERIIGRLQKLPGHAQLLITLREVSQVVDNCSYVDVLASPEDLQCYTLCHLQSYSALISLFQENGSWKYELLCEVVRTLVDRSHGL